MKIALAQINTTLGDFEYNLSLIRQHIKVAKGKGADVVIFPELALMGYPPLDLLERPNCVQDQLKVLRKLERQVPEGLLVLVGAVTENPKQGKPYYNSVAAIQKGKATKFFHKSLLPAYDVFDEARHFHFGSVANNILRFKGRKILITICEDIWAWKKEERLHHANPLKEISADQVDLIFNLSASPFSLGKDDMRLEMAQKTSRHFKAPLVYVNAVGAQDEVIFDGASFVLGKRGEKVLQLPSFKEHLSLWDSDEKWSGRPAKEESETQLLRAALTTGIRDFCRKNLISKVHFGLSGGIDSAVIALLACEALGAENVHALALPGPFSSDLSLKLAKDLCEELGIGLDVIEITPAYEFAVQGLEKAWGHQEFSLIHENLQARLRGMMLMAYSNKTSSLLLNTSNKSEFASGYSTLYGDMCGGLAPLGDLLKGQVYDLAKTYLTKGSVLQAIIDRAPTAELRENQRDQDTLPPYDLLDRAVKNIVENKGPVSSETDKWLEKALVRSEFKRWQAPPILRISNHAFGRGRRWPISHRLQRL
jgi:NAD+ synthase (glutamine-hydrolysing)